MFIYAFMRNKETLMYYHEISKNVTMGKWFLRAFTEIENNNYNSFFFCYSKTIAYMNT